MSNIYSNYDNSIKGVKLQEINETTKYFTINLHIKTILAFNGYINMGTAKRNSQNITPRDGRKNNGRKPGEKLVKNQAKLTPAKLNKAKRDRMTVYATNAIISTYGSEEAFWEMMAGKARKSFSHAKMVVEYAYGKPQDTVGAPTNNKAPTINFYNTKQPVDETIDISHEEEDRPTQ